MILSVLLDLSRVLAGWLLLYGVLPLLIRRPGFSWVERIAAGFIESTILMQATVMILGDWRLCYPGTLAVAYAAWLAIRVIDQRVFHDLFRGEQLRGGFGAEGWPRQLVEMWTVLDHDRRGFISRFRFPSLAMIDQWIAVGAAGMLILAARFPINNVRFLTDESYSRALSLQLLTHNSGWDGNGSVALLAPIVFLTGVGAVAAARWSGPILSTLLVLAAGYCGWTITRKRSVAIAAMLLAEVWLWWSTGGLMSEPGALDFSSLFWLLALASLRGRPIWVACAAVTALSINFHFPAPVWPLFLVAMVGIALGRLIDSLTPRMREAVVAASMIGLMLLGFVDAPAATQDGPHQYEASARAVQRIARDFPRRSWLLISTQEEVPLLYDRGWHAELADAVRTISLEDAARPGFVLPYDVPDVFMLVEKRPLTQQLVGVPADADSAVFAYSTQAGRQSLQFQAARLAEAYSANHKGSRIYYEDQDITVYHFHRE